MENLPNPWGVIVARHEGSRRQLERAVHTGVLAKVLPGVFRPASEPETMRHRVGAVLAYAPDAIFTHHVAAAELWWPDLPVPTITVAGARLRAPWFQGSQRVVPSSQRVVVHGVTVTTPALTALDLVDHLGGEALDEAFRRGAATLADLHQALADTAHRPGNAMRRWLVHDSRDTPWSPLERDGHRRLRAAGLVGWRSNHEVRIRGRRFFLDIAVPELKVAAELDGYQHHSDREQFERDRIKHNALAAEGWTTYMFTARTIDELVPTLIRQGVRRVA